MCRVFSYDGIHDPAILAINGASAAMAISDVPCAGPIGAVRVGLVGDRLVINPSDSDMVTSKLNIIVACSDDRIVMAEGQGAEVEEARFCEAVQMGLTSVQPIIAAIQQFSKECGVAKRCFDPFLPPEYVEKHMSTFSDQIIAVLLNVAHSKTSRDDNLFGILDVAKEQLLASHEYTNTRLVQDSFWKLVGHCYGDLVLDRGVRCDGRLVNELRPISCETDIFPTLHGSSLFRRGETAVFSAVTMDTPDKVSKLDLVTRIIEGKQHKNFMLHYDFPPYATNTIGQNIGIQRRREIGHGLLAEKALQSQVPGDFPFTTRVACEVTDSNGSSSMASVCGASLALFDAGVPMTAATAGVACGLVTQSGCHDNDTFPKYKILTDILGFEDAVGNMDFKMAGTRHGITSLQVDVKNMLGIPIDLFEEAVHISKEARHQVLDVMATTQSCPRSTTKPSAPCSVTLQVPGNKRSMVFSTGSNCVKAKLGIENEIYFHDINESTIAVYSYDQATMDRLLPKIKALLENGVDLEFGKPYSFKVAEIRTYGVLLQVTSTCTSLLHVNEMSPEVLQKFNKRTLKVSDEVPEVYYIGKNELTGRQSITQKEAILAEARRKLENTQKKT
ncbi:polyribonucleotide nucleotidyltransferase 1, mitochondrial-like isoform X2 [Dysidea avara]